MAAYSTGSSWAFPEDLPGGFKAEHMSDTMPPEQECKMQRDMEDVDGQESTHIPPPREDTPQQEAAEDAQPHPDRKHWPPRTCRICLEVVQPTLHFDPTSLLPEALQPSPRVTYDSEEGGRLLRPCKCKGSQKYVHEECLSAWRKADPLQKRNYYECPTCRYKYHLQRLTWSNWISSTAAQIGLTIAIFITAMFLLGFVADPIINLYLDPVDTVATAGGPTGSFVYDDEYVGWAEHFAKGLASLGLVGFAKFMFTLNPWHVLRIGGGGGVARSNVGGTGRDRLRDISWITILIGVVTMLYAVWKGVRTWSRRTLESAGERVMDVPGGKDDDDDDEQVS